MKKHRLKLAEPADPHLPKSLQDQLNAFLVDRRTGNIRINIRNGRVVGFEVNELRFKKIGRMRSDDGSR